MKQDSMEKLAEFTLSLCDRLCTSQAPFRCCDPMYCQLALDYAESLGEPLARTDHATLPLMGADNRCTAPARLRPMCSAHHCDIAALGFFKPRAGFPATEALKATRKYFRLREKADADVLVDEQWTSNGRAIKQSK